MYLTHARGERAPSEWNSTFAHPVDILEVNFSWRTVDIVASMGDSGENIATDLLHQFLRFPTVPTGRIGA